MERFPQDARFDDAAINYQSIFDATPNAIGVCVPTLPRAGEEPDFAFHSVNPAFERRFNIRQLDILDRPLSEIEGTLGLKERRKLTLVLQTGGATHWGFFSTRLQRWFEVTAFRGQPQHVILLFVDITERKLEEQIALEEGLKFRTFFELGAVKLVIDASTQAIIEANQRAADYYGWTVEELRGMSISQINVLSSLEIQEEIELVKGTQRSFFRFKHQMKDGEVREVEVHSAAGAWGQTPAVFSIILDKTQETKLHQQVVRQEKLVRVGVLTASLIHEVSNILGAMQSHMALIGEETSDNPSIAKRLALLERQFERSRALIHAFRNLSIQESVAKEPFSGHRLIEETMALESAQCQHDGIALSLQKEGSDAIVLVHVALFQQVLMNLLINAIQSLTGTAQPSITIIAQATDDWFSVSVGNNGPPVDAHTRARLFQAFHTTKVGGSGLGLSFSKMVMELHGGAIELEDSKKTVFTVRLPRMATTR